MIEALLDFYRCPESFVNFSLSGELSSESSYFHFGEGTLCYGQSCSALSKKLAGNGFRDFVEQVSFSGSILQLPFDPTQLVNNLRCEHYAKNGYPGRRGILSSRSVQNLYYCLRPFLGITIRKRFQQLFLHGWDKLPFPAWPVDRTVELLLERLLFLTIRMQNLDKLPFIWFWPKGAPSCAIITHDVETQTGLDSVMRLMDIDEEYGIKASFQLIPQKQYGVSQQLLNAIRKRGFEVNVQDLTHDGNLFSNREKFFDRARLINRYLREYGARGFRAGRMYRNFDWLGALRISYDMSVPNTAHLEAQRGGCCTVFPYFIGEILELPLTTTQDYSLFHILGDYSTGLWKKQIDLIMEKHGLVSFLVHPDYCMDSKALKVYKALLRYLADLRDTGKLCITLPRTVDQWWRDRSRMRLVPDGDSWRIEGPGSKHARVAYASLDGYHVMYAVGNNNEPSISDRFYSSTARPAADNMGFAITSKEMV